MSKNSHCLAITGLAAAVILWMGAAGAQAQAPNLAPGRKIFDTTCSSPSCHGVHGKGGQGPNLQKLDFTADQLRDAIARGRPGTAMAPFSGALTDAQVGHVVDYVLSLSAEAAAQSPTSIPFNGPPAKPSAPEPGADIFFDSRRAAHCGACHRLQDRGGPIGPDLSTLTERSAAEIRSAIEHPAPNNPAYLAIEIKNRAGQTMVGVKRDESATLLRLFDISSIPPVARTFLKSDLTETRLLAGQVLYKHDLSRYSQAELTDLLDFLRSAPPQDQGR